MMLRKLVVALALSLSHADNLRATRSRGRTLQEVNLVPEDEAADLKKQEEAQREKAMAEAAAAMEKAKAMLAEAEKAKILADAAARKAHLEAEVAYLYRPGGERARSVQQHFDGLVEASAGSANSPESSANSVPTKRARH